jgi:hypothetical protein
MTTRKLPTDDVLAALYTAGATVKEIADKYGAAQSSVWRILHRLGVLRTLSEAHKLSYALGKRVPYGPSGEKAGRWKDGSQRRGYREVVVKTACALCNATNKLCIHHIDLDHFNNAPENLQVLCVSCHMRLHKKMFWEARRAGLDPPKSNGPVSWNGYQPAGAESSRETGCAKKGINEQVATDEA